MKNEKEIDIIREVYMAILEDISNIGESETKATLYKKYCHKLDLIDYIKKD